jgi:copper chaperone NosL
VAGWIVVAAATLAFGVWFAEWYQRRKNKALSVSRSAILSAAASLLFFLSSCNTKPEPFQVGKDVCHFCKMGISDTRFGGEIITKKGKIYKFDDLHCLISFLRAGGEAEKNISQTVIINFEKPNEFIPASSTTFVVTSELKSPMGANAAGFINKAAADNYASHKQAEIINWQQLFNKITN